MAMSTCGATVSGAGVSTTSASGTASSVCFAFGLRRFAGCVATEVTILSLPARCPAFDHETLARTASTLKGYSSGVARPRSTATVISLM